MWSNPLILVNDKLEFWKKKTATKPKREKEGHRTKVTKRGKKIKRTSSKWDKAHTHSSSKRMKRDPSYRTRYALRYNGGAVHIHAALFTSSLSFYQRWDTSVVISLLCIAAGTPAIAHFVSMFMGTLVFPLSQEGYRSFVLRSLPDTAGFFLCCFLTFAVSQTKIKAYHLGGTNLRNVSSRMSTRCICSAFPFNKSNWI